MKHESPEAGRRFFGLSRKEKGGKTPKGKDKKEGWGRQLWTESFSPKPGVHELERAVEDKKTRKVSITGQVAITFRKNS